MYNFDGIEKNLNKKTFTREEKAKEVAGLTLEIGGALQNTNIKFQAYYEAYQKEVDDVKKAELMDNILVVNAETIRLRGEMEWHRDYNKAIAVMDVLLVEGSSGLTKDNFCGDDAEVIWNDFFTQKSNVKSTQSPQKSTE